MDPIRRSEILKRYRDHSRRFDASAARRRARSTPIVSLGHLTEPEPTAREIEVLQLVADGLANREIGGRLLLSEETIKSHAKHLFAKLRARSRAHAVAIGFRRGLIS